ncbi:hypothetical protein P8452_37735 [Trifolium repens]|nr:hypothetical protein P8452_37735 [Trifolium repens]
MNFSAEKMIFGVAGIDPERSAVLDINLSWRLHKASMVKEEECKLVSSMVKEEECKLVWVSSYLSRQMGCLRRRRNLHPEIGPNSLLCCTCDIKILWFCSIILFLSQDNHRYLSFYSIYFVNA